MICIRNQLRRTRHRQWLCIQFLLFLFPGRCHYLFCFYKEQKLESEVRPFRRDEDLGRQNIGHSHGFTSNLECFRPNSIEMMTGEFSFNGYLALSVTWNGKILPYSTINAKTPLSLGVHNPALF